MVLILKISTMGSACTRLLLMPDLPVRTVMGAKVMVDVPIVM
jgi:hypothetical protein